MFYAQEYLSGKALGTQLASELLHLSMHLSSFLHSNMFVSSHFPKKGTAQWILLLLTCTHSFIVREPCHHRVIPNTFLLLNLKEMCLSPLIFPSRVLLIQDS